MERGFNTLSTTPAAKPFSIYHKYDTVKGITEYNSDIPINQVVEKISDGLSFSKIDSCDPYRVKQLRPYRHLDNQWSARMMHEWSKRFNVKKNAILWKSMTTVRGTYRETGSLPRFTFSSRDRLFAKDQEPHCPKTYVLERDRK